MSGPAELLVRYGLVTQQMVDLIPKCGIRPFMSMEGNKRLGIPYRATLRRKRDDLLEVKHRIFEGDEHKELCKRLGIDPPKPEINSTAAPRPGESWKRRSVFQVGARLDLTVEALPALLKNVNTRSRCIGRFRRPVQWAKWEKLVVIDWDAIRYPHTFRLD